MLFKIVASCLSVANHNVASKQKSNSALGQHKNYIKEILGFGKPFCHYRGVFC